MQEEIENHRIFHLPTYLHIVITYIIQTTLPSSWETCMQVKKQEIEPDMEQ